MKKLIASNIYSARPIYGGVRISEDSSIYFNWLQDEIDKDVLSLVKPQSGSYDEDGVQYVFGYTYNSNATQQDKKEFRNYIKHAYDNGAIYSEDLEEFVERAVLELDRYHPLEDFKVTIDTQSSQPISVQHMMWEYIVEYGSRVEYDFELLKQTYADVKFDADKARKAMEASNISTNKINKELNFLLNKFEQLKESGELFQMKRFTPREIRAGFYDFLKFKNEEEENLYKSLQGVDVLIYDDLMISGATVKEIIRYLRSFHDENRLTVFVLIKQH